MESNVTTQTYQDKLALALRAFLDGDFTNAESLTKGILRQQQDNITFEILRSGFMDQVTTSIRAALQALNPVDRFVIQHYIYFNEGHYSASYHGWRMKRVRKLMEVYGIDFEGKRILELGAGIGDIGSIFAELGADVIGLEGRAANCNLANLRFRKMKNYQVRQWDLEQHLGQEFLDLGPFDFIILFGLVEVIENFVPLLDCCMQLSNTLFLETLVCDSTDPDKVLYVDMHAGQSDDWPLSGRSPRPSPTYIERLFSNQGFKVNRHFDKDLNYCPHFYSWEHANDDKTPYGLRRYWSFTKSA